MARTPAQVSQDIRTRLKVLDPDISAEPETVERKIIDAVADTIAGVELDQYIINYQYDIDTKVGADLDKFAALFGFARQGGRRSTGFVTFSRSTVATSDIVIPAGTQVMKPATSVSPAVVFVTTAAGTIYIGTTDVEVPVESTVIGGFSNVPANTITALGVSGAAEVSEVTNENATSGGSNEETDAELRVRFKNTIFRNVAGTSDQYLALAIASRFANKANVIGPISRFIEYLQIAASSATSQIPYSKYTYNFDYYLTDGDITDETFYSPRGVDYTFNTTTPPTITVNNAGSLPNSTIVLLEHSYCSANSRNDPVNNINNYVDVYVSGQDVTGVLESSQFPPVGNNFNNTSSSAYYVGKFKRPNTNVTPFTTSRFQELLWQPVAELPNAITIGSQTFYENVDYWFVADITAYKGSRRARNGIEWSAAAASAVTAGTNFVITYDFDKLPLTLNELMDTHKQVTTDVLVHSATERYFIVNLIVMYSAGFSRATVDEAIATALTTFLEKLQFGAVIQISDILEVAHEVPGVDNVRLATAADGVAYGITEVAADGVTPIDVPHTSDFAIQDSDLPVLQDVVTTQRSQNTWSN
jgi:uncharacterized phage protein gp47/JayE